MRYTSKSKKNQTYKRVLEKNVAIFFVFFVTLTIVAIRYHDFKGSFFLGAYDFSTVEGVVLESRLAAGGRSSRFVIKYRYFVDNIPYISDRFSFGWDRTIHRKKIEGFIKKYPKGSEVTVFYSKLDHSFSVIEPERNSKLQFLLFFGGLWGWGVWMHFLINNRKSGTLTN